MKAQAMNPDIKVELIEIGSLMHKAKLPNAFIAAAVETAFAFEGVYDLMKMWAEETDKAEREEIVADIQDLINDCAQKEKVEGVYIRFDDLDKIAANIRAFKNSLLLKVNALGGISKLSELTGIPQPSLSRFFNSASMPQRATLLKIAKALGMSQVEIATEWSR
ncbi:MAG: helix-turn-helix transcriptional regulator [Bdellovibrionales bacterium]|nr:helix-turn-helix transcriptional regulator [Bdellovibrionales bacterium]